MDLFPIGSSVSHFIIAFDKRCFFLLFNNPASGFVLPSDSDYIGSTHKKEWGMIIITYIESIIMCRMKVVD